MRDTADFDSVPFGNSIFQIQHFTDGNETPFRRRRHCLLQLNQKYNALKECEFRRKRIEIDIDEINEKLGSVDEFAKKRLQVDLEEKEHHLSIEIKLIKDCLVEVAAYNKLLDDLPKCTREEFEAGERDYWKKRLLDEAKNEISASGTVSAAIIGSLKNIGIVVQRDEEGVLHCLLASPQPKLLSEILAEANDGNILKGGDNERDVLRID